MAPLFLFGLVLALLFLGVPVGLALGLSSVLYVALFTTDSLSSVAISLVWCGHALHLALPFRFYFGLGVHVHRRRGAPADSVCHCGGGAIPRGLHHGLGAGYA